MEFNDVENLSEPQILELYSDVVERQSDYFISASGYYDWCDGDMHELYCDSTYNHMKWHEDCLRCYDSNHDGVTNDKECEVYYVSHDGGPWAGGKCPTYGGIK